MSHKLSWRDHARAGLIALHMGALLVMCLPVPGRMGKPQQNDPGFQSQLRQWRSVGRAVGIQLSQEEALALVIDVTDVMRVVRHKAVNVVKPYIRRVGAGQAWQMFGVVQKTPARLRVEVREGGEWRDLYVHADATADWNARFMRSERMRALLNQYSWRARPSSYERLGSWMACQAKAELPDATELRTTMEVLALPGPARLRETGTIPVKSTRWERSYDLDTCDEDAP